jgi:regulator of nucleoside diphosphate kinase
MHFQQSCDLERTMTHAPELFVSASDVERLAAMIAGQRRVRSLEPDPTDELTDLLMEARLLESERLPEDCVRMHSTVTYVEQPGGMQRTVTLEYPEDADAAQGKVSVLSPIGLALIGRKVGAVIAPAMPNGRAMTIRIRAVDHAEPLKKAA